MPIYRDDHQNLENYLQVDCSTVMLPFARIKGKRKKIIQGWGIKLIQYNKFLLLK